MTTVRITDPVSSAKETDDGRLRAALVTLDEMSTMIDGVADSLAHLEGFNVVPTLLVHDNIRDEYCRIAAHLARLENSCA